MPDPNIGDIILTPDADWQAHDRAWRIAMENARHYIGKEIRMILKPGFHKFSPDSVMFDAGVFGLTIRFNCTSREGWVTVRFMPFETPERMPHYPASGKVVDTENLFRGDEFGPHTASKGILDEPWAGKGFDKSLAAERLSYGHPEFPPVETGATNWTEGGAIV
jgi:hypothetical protein